MIIKKSEFLPVFISILAYHRTKLLNAGYDKASLTRMKILYDAYVSRMVAYLKYKLIVFKHHFKHLWSENWFHIFNGSASARRHNSVSLHLGDALSRIGSMYGWLEENNGK